MKKPFAFIIVLVVALSGCNKQKEVALQKEVDSLRVEMAVNRQMTETLQEVGLMIDSIDVNRHALKTDLVEGTSYVDYTNRMREINVYVAATAGKIVELETALKKSKGSTANYVAMVSKLKKELEARTKELTELTGQVAMYKAKNDTLMTTVELQTAEINDKAEQLAAKQQQLSELEEQVRQVTEQAKFDLADAYYQRAVALEEAAKRTHFAPKKKKSTQREALELYKLAATSGKVEANDKITRLEKEI
jgi:chromosome segregation ATPase